MANPKGNPQNLILFKPGQSGNPNGRPRKVVSTLTHLGYKKSEVNDTIQNMMALTQGELRQIYEDPNATILERTIANALNKGLIKGSLFAIEGLLTRAFGMPRIEVEASFRETPIFNTIDLSSDAVKVVETPAQNEGV
jgi:hypothetical protein